MRNLRHVDTIRLWRGEFGSTPPFDIGPDTLFVALQPVGRNDVLPACSAGGFPVHVYDLHTAYLATSNILLPYNPDEVRKKPRKRLSDACRAYGIEGWENIDKPEMAKAIGEGRWREYGREAVLQYCEEDARNSAELLRRQTHRLRQARSRRSRARHALERATAPRPSPGFRPRGMPIDMPLWNLVQENKQAVIGALIRRFDPSQGSENPIYSPDGEWSNERFRALAGIRRHHGVAATGLRRARTDGDAFRMMYGVHPAIEGLHALRDSLGVIVRARIPIGRDGRNRPSLFPFGTATGRNAQAKSLFNAHASMRSFMKFPRRQDRALPRLANAGGRDCGRAQRR